MDKKELEEIINSQSWIKIKKFDPKDPTLYINNAMELYYKLEEHHIKETKFLINKCKELANELLKKL